MKELILNEIEKLKNEEFDGRIKHFMKYNNRYAILKDSVEVVVRLKEGIEATIDITDLIINSKK